MPDTWKQISDRISVISSFAKKERLITIETTTPLAFGACFGGIAGKKLFEIIKNSVSWQSGVVGIQSVVLGVLLIICFIYTLKKKSIRTFSVKHKSVCVLIGVALGTFSSFLGIGGGPINIMVLHFFFSMPAKVAAANSLYTILFSQLASLCVTLFSGNVLNYNITYLSVMIIGAIFGGIIGRTINKRIENGSVDKLFLLALVLIICICGYNSINAFI